MISCSFKLGKDGGDEEEEEVTKGTDGGGQDTGVGRRQDRRTGASQEAPSGNEKPDR